MSKVRRLRALVNARLTAAAEEIFALVERTIAEYEEELCRSKEENQRNQQLGSVFEASQSRGLGAGVQMETSPDLVKRKTPETAQIKEEPEEHLLKQEEEQLPEFTAVCVKSEEQSSLLQQRQTEHRELTQGEHCGGAGADISLDPHGHLHSQTEEQTDNDEDWEPPASSSTAQMETEADGDHYNQVQIKDTSTAAHNSGLFSKYKCGAESRATVTEGHGSETGSEGGETLKCPFCQKSFTTEHNLEVHTKVHTGEKTYRCPICRSLFLQKCSLNAHVRLHREGNLYRCSVCGRAFPQLSSLTQHDRTHTGEKPYSCSVCNNRFTQHHHLTEHMRTHTGERPYSCSVCGKTFARSFTLKIHHRQHKTVNVDLSAPNEAEAGPETGATDEFGSGLGAGLRSGPEVSAFTKILTQRGVKLYRCLICGRTFAQLSSLTQHRRTHTGEKPYSCSVCNNRFTQQHHMTEHMRIHTGERPYSCSVCGKTFARSFTLKIHMKTHRATPCSSSAPCSSSVLGYSPKTNLLVKVEPQEQLQEQRNTPYQS